jgi:hypothetical protein
MTGLKFRISSFVMQDLALLTFLSLITLTWFRGAQLIWGDDSNLPLSPGTAISAYSYIWDPSVSAIDPSKFAYVVPVGLILKLLGSAGLYSPFFFERAEMVIIMFFSGFSLYYLAGVVLEGRPYRRYGQITAAIFHMFNFYAMITIWPSLAGIIFHYAFFPLIIGLIIRGLKDGRGVKYAALVSIAWTILVGAAYVTFPIVLTDWLVIGLVAFYWLAVTHTLKEAKRTVIYFGTVLSCWFILNVSWIYANLSSFEDLLLRVSGSAASYSGQNVPALQGLSLFGYWGFFVGVGSSLYYPYSPIYLTLPFTLLILTIPLLVGLALLLNGRSPFVLFFASLAIMFIIFATGTTSGFSALNNWLFSNPILSDAFRSPYQKFMDYASLGYAIVFGALASYSSLSNGSNKKAHPKYRLALVAGMLVLVSGVMVWPMWTGNLYQTQGVFPSMNIDIPQSYNQFASWLSEQSGNFAVLPFPYPMSAASIPLLWDNGTQGYSGIYPFLLLSNDEFLVANGLGAYAANAILTQKANDSSFLNYFNVKFVIVHTDADWSLIQDTQAYLGTNISQIDQSLLALNGLKYVQSFGNIDVYLNTKWSQSAVYALDATAVPLDNNDLFLQDHTIVPGSVEMINPTSYLVNIDSSGTFRIVLTQSFDPGWLAYVNGLEVNSSQHFDVGGLMNGWSISCASNCNIEIVFAPQTVVTDLQILSGVFFVIIVTLIAFFSLPRKRGHEHL